MVLWVWPVEVPVLVELGACPEEPETPEGELVVEGGDEVVLVDSLEEADDSEVVEEVVVVGGEDRRSGRAA